MGARRRNRLRGCSQTFAEIVASEESANARKLWRKACDANRIAKFTFGKTQRMAYQVKVGVLKHGICKTGFTVRPDNEGRKRLCLVQRNGRNRLHMFVRDVPLEARKLLMGLSDGGATAA